MLNHILQTIQWGTCSDIEIHLTDNLDNNNIEYTHCTVKDKALLNIIIFPI